MKKKFCVFALVCALYCSVVKWQLLVHSPKLEKDVQEKGERVDQRGWKPLASSSTLWVCFFQISYRTYLEEDPENRIELVGIAIGKKCKIGRENAIMNGITSYASRAKAQVVGKMKGLMSSEASSTRKGD